jgi:arginine exporter protein ArgO
MMLLKSQGAEENPPMPASALAAPTTTAVFVQGCAMGAGLILAIGAQNALVLRQGLRREHVGAVVAVCTLSDWLLIVLGVAAYFIIAPMLDDLQELEQVMELPTE